MHDVGNPVRIYAQSLERQNRQFGGKSCSVVYWKINQFQDCLAPFRRYNTNATEKRTDEIAIAYTARAYFGESLRLPQ